MFVLIILFKFYCYYYKFIASLRLYYCYYTLERIKNVLSTKINNSMSNNTKVSHLKKYINKTKHHLKTNTLKHLLTSHNVRHSHSN